jgi:acetate kinase
LTPLAPDHAPPSLDAIEITTARFPSVPQAACFDTTFHRHMPDLARMYPLPRRYLRAGVCRYGFHGLSCESVLATLGALDPRAGSGRIVIAHLGNGASMTAVRDGQGVETTMGFSPMGGLMMGTRPGDLDPGVLLYALDHEGLTAEALRHLVTQESGLLGVSGRSADMAALLAQETSDSQAREAVTLFCYLARKALGSLMAVLGGLDTLVFTGGIGEHAAPVRDRICANLEGLGIRLDPAANGSHAEVISASASPVTVRVIRSDEDRVLAGHALRLLARSRPGG